MPTIHHIINLIAATNLTQPLSHYVQELGLKTGYANRAARHTASHGSEATTY